MPRKASHLSSLFIGNFTWSYIFIRHMICVLLGASFYFVRIFLMLFRIMFCTYILNKNVKDSLYHACFASIHVAVWKQKVYRCCKNSREKSECYKMLKTFGNFLSYFLELGKYGSCCILYRLYCFGRLLLCLHCLHMFACLMIYLRIGVLNMQRHLVFNVE